MGADEEGTHERLKAHLGEPKIGEHRGRIVKTTGDGVLAEFASVVDAVRCAGEIQGAMADRDLDLAEERRLRFRIGVNLGDVIADGDDIFGDGVNVAARLEALAEPGGICISRMVHDQIRDKLEYRFEDLGEQSVKNIARPVRTYALRPEGFASLPAPGLPVRPSLRGRAIIGAAAAAALVIVGIAWWFWPAATSPSGAEKPAAPATAVSAPMPVAPAAPSIPQPAAAPRLSIVVLPFANLNNDPEQQYFADAMTEDLTTDLSRISGSFVISRNTAFTYKDKPVNAKQIGRELHVRYVLEGSVRRAGNQIRVTAQLIDAETDAHLWAERFDRGIGDLFAVQNEITSRIAIALNMELLGAEAARPTDNPDALDYILRGQAASLKPPSREKYAEQIPLFERALALDPRSVEAQSRLASALTARVVDFMSDSAAADITRAEGLVGQALAASPRSPNAHYARAQVLRAQRRFQEAIPEYETALAFNRNRVSALGALAICKLNIGSLEEVIPLLEQAIQLGPRDPQLGVWYRVTGLVHLLQSRTDEAIVWFQKGLGANPEHSSSHALLAAAYGLKGESERAAAELAEARRLVGGDRFSSIAHVRATGFYGSQTLALYEATYFAGLRKAGMPEE